MGVTEKKSRKQTISKKDHKPVDQESGPTVEGREEESVDRIRDILFGAQMRDYEKRFRILESRLLQENEELRREINNRFDALEKYMQKEVETLTGRARTEDTRRAKAERKMETDLKASSQALEGKVSSLDEQTSKAVRELRQQILGQSKDLGDDIRRKTEQLAKTLAEEIAQLRATKTDRTALASILTEAALKVNADSEPSE